MSRTLYEKRGRRYYPVLEKDVWSGDSWEKGCHLVICEPGVRSIKYKIEPNESAILAAIHIHASEIAQMIQESSSLKIKSEPMSQEQIKTWELLQNSFGDKKFLLTYPSAFDIANKFLEELKKKTINNNL